MDGGTQVTMIRNTVLMEVCSQNHRTLKWHTKAVGRRGSSRRLVRYIYLHPHNYNIGTIVAGAPEELGSRFDAPGRQQLEALVSSSRSVVLLAMRAENTLAS